MTPLSVNYEDTIFLQTGTIHAEALRLNWRCEMLLTRNVEAIKNKRILDLASHDGRFSYACLKLGAKHVTGIENTGHLVDSAKKNLEVLGYNSENFAFLQGDIYEFLPKFNSGDFDTILCFGFFYHTMRHVELLSKIKRLCPQWFILDTDIHRENYIMKLLLLMRTIKRFRPKHLILRNLKELVASLKEYKLVFTGDAGEPNTIDRSDWVAVPTKSAVELLLTLHDFNFRQINWYEANISSWERLEDYKMGSRISYIAKLNIPFRHYIM